MPLDATSSEARALLDLDRPSLRALSVVLRDRRLWPREFRRYGWYYGDCESCAIGLSLALWGEFWKNCSDIFLAQTFGMSTEQFDAIFYQATCHFAVDDSSLITPEHIADIIDQFLATEEAKPARIPATA